ncbi:MAG: hypothetical protein JXR88_02515 [Clostridia bacterium]|nr:hypothetical protein [Clostridia bacterium]
MNNSLLRILKEHQNTYPLMNFVDLIKIIYQNEFAGGHMIKNENVALQRLLEEMETIEKNNDRLFEPLGNGLCRIQLKAAKDGILNSTLNRFFVLTANHRKGEVKSYEEKLDWFVHAIEQGAFECNIDEVLTYVQNQKDLGYPAMHHSALYNKTYQPAYRVVDDIFRIYYEIFHRIDFLKKTKDKVIIAIDGYCGSGKSTLGNLLREVYGCSLIKMDDFYLPQDQKTEERLNEPGGNVDYDRFKKEILIPLSEDKTVMYQSFDCKKQSLRSPITLERTPLVIVEGSYSMHPTLKAYYDLKIFLKVDSEIQIKRILDRNGSEVLKRFQTLWIPLENHYFEHFQLENEVDLVFNTSEIQINF